MVDLVKSSLGIPTQFDDHGELMVLTAKGYKYPAQIGITLVDPAGGTGGGTSGPITLVDGADVTTGSKTDPIATDLSNATLMSVIKANTEASLKLVQALGTKANGVAAGVSILTGAVYETTPAAITAGQQRSLLVDQYGSLLNSLKGAGSNIGVGALVTNADGQVTTGGRLSTNTVNLLLNEAGTLDRERGDGGYRYALPAPPQTNAGSQGAVTVSGTSVVSATTIATISNPNLRYKKLVLHVTNQSAVAFIDFLIKTKCNPSDASYDTTYTAQDDYTDPAGYITEVSANPATLSNGTARIILDISLFSSIQIAAVVASTSTTAIARWFMVAV